MSLPPIIGREHKAINFAEDSPVKAHLDSLQLKWNNPKMLGLHHAQDGIRPGNFIGMVWIGEGDSRVVLRVDAKFEGMDYIRMFCECAEDPTVSEHFDCLHLEEGDLIDAPQSEDFSLLIAVAYLRELKALCSRHLRRHFLRERQNFAGKVKGKILAGENLRRNVLRCRPDRVYCEYQSVSDDILENRILRTALERAARYVARNKINTKSVKEELPRVQEWIRLCRSRLCGVSIAPIRPRDFAAARKRGVFAHYARPLQLAKAVLRQLGFNPQTELNESAKTPPYAINSEELFERFAELKLREHFRQKGLELVAPRNNIDGKFFGKKLRPDFYVPLAAEAGCEHSPHILDAKYKSLKSRTETGAHKNPAHGDIYQVVAYSRHKGVAEKLQNKKTSSLDADKIKLSLVYPRLENNANGEVAESETTDAFHSELKIQTVPCPVKPAKQDSKNESNQKAAAGQGGGEPQAGQGEGRQHGDVQKQ